VVEVDAMASIMSRVARYGSTATG